MTKKVYRDSFIAAHISNTVASQIAAMREARGWTQTQLADEAGMKQSRISSLEDPNYENFEAGTLRRIASAFDVGLTIKFVPFSEIVQWSTELNAEKITPVRFEADLCPRPHANSQYLIVSIIAPANIPFAGIVGGDGGSEGAYSFAAVGTGGNFGPAWSHIPAHGGLVALPA